MLEIGSVIDGKYKILNKVGQGGMSIVYLAMNEKANKQWAIKEIRKDGVSNYEVVKQGLVAETDILKRLSHPNLPSIIDVIDQEDTFLIVMDYIEGNTLSNALENYGAQSQSDVIAWAKELCDVLGYLHSRKPPIIYRDMKPSNVMLKPDGHVTLIDFGTAREFKETSVEDTKCLGTQGYAAPEQYGGHGQTDARTDIYCLGATLYHLLTAHNPCQPPYEMYPIRYWNPELSSGLEEIILKCTQKNPDDRYQSCEELLYNLEHYEKLDIEYQKSANRKWKCFLASGLLTMATVAGAIGFRSAANMEIGNSYEGYLAAAAGADLQQAMEYYKHSVNLKPSDEKAYQAMLSYVLSDNEISSEEDAGMRAIFNENKGGARSNIEYLKLNNRDAYEAFAYDLGNAYYYTYEGTDNKAKSQNWFADAANAQSLDKRKISRAECLENIASYSAILGKKNQAGDADVTYYDYWEDITKLLNDGTVSADNNITELRSYKNFLYNIFTYTKDFKDAGIKEEEISLQMEKVFRTVAAIQADTDNPVEEELRQDIEDYTKKARQALDATYRGTASQPEEEAP